MHRALHIDIETYSSVDIKKSGAFKYAQAPDFELLLLAYAYDDEPIRIIDLSTDAVPVNLLEDLFDPAITKFAYNAAFEWYCLYQVFGNHFELRPEEWAEQWHCSMLHGQYLGYPAGLGAISGALGLGEDKQKLNTGNALIRYFCVPCKPTKTNGGRTRNQVKHDPARWDLFKQYCVRDVEAEREIENRLRNFPLPDGIQQQWIQDLAINLRGVAVDMDFVAAAMDCDTAVRSALMAEAQQISGLNNPNSTKQLLSWLEEELDEDAPQNLRKETVDTVIAKGVDSTEAQRILEIRQELSKASIKKYAALAAATGDDGRIRGTLQFYGANRTGRWAGRLVQPQNLPRIYINELSLARELVKARNMDAVKLCFGSLSGALSQLVRTALVAPAGNILLDADFSAIEARVLAWLADESWRLEVFETHGKIYEASAAQMFSVPIEAIVKGNPEYALRAKGKVAELALGYQGGPLALTRMGALKEGIPKEELPEIVSLWRQRNQNIVQFWYAVETAAVNTIQTGQAQQLPHGIVIALEGDRDNGLLFMTIRLPSDRKLYYVNPRLAVNEKGKQSIVYDGVDKKWGPQDTYGGKLVENITQAFARDCLAVALERLEIAGFKIVFHVHDEIVVEWKLKSGDPDVVCDETFDTLDNMCTLMSQPIYWAPGLPLGADGYVSEFYKKD